VHAWIFRHRARLRVIYGVAAPAERESARGAQRAAGKARAGDGSVRRSGRYVVLRPRRAS
jgi:hypothetical protein